MDIRPYFIINGKSSNSIRGLIVSELAPIKKAQVRTLIETVDGRDGDIVTPLGYAAYDKPVKIGLSVNYDIDEIIDYLNSEGTIVFSNEPDKYYRFSVYNEIDFERLIRFKTASVVFHVQPYKFSTLEKELAFEISESPESISIYNAGNVYSRPTIYISAEGIVSVSLNGSEILEIDFGEDEQTIKIDSESMNAYYSDDTLANRIVTGNYDNIKLNKGWNTITLSGSVSELSVRNYTRYI